MTYLPDTNACIALLRQRNPKLMARWQAAKASEVGILGAFYFLSAIRGRPRGRGENRSNRSRR